jgi:protein SCO1/2
MGNETKKKNNRLALLFALVIVLLLVFVVWKITSRADHITQVKSQAKISGTILKAPLTMPTFSLQQFGGKPYTNANLKGHWTLLFFGFSNCPYVCPTTLAQLNVMLKQLKQVGIKDNLPQVVMVSVDPARDSVKRMHAYVTSFNPGFIGLRTTEAKTLQLAKQMRVSFAKIQAPGSDSGRYTITHTATITVIGPEGKIRAYLSYPHKAPVMARDYQAILRSVR